MKIEVLYFEGCPHHRPAVQLVQGVLADLKLDAEVEEINVEHPDQAGGLRSLGSPSIRVNGVDVEPAARSRTDFGYTCRTYDRGAGLPDREMVVVGITESAEAVSVDERRDKLRVFNQVMVWASAAMVTGLILLPKWGPAVFDDSDTKAVLAPAASVRAKAASLLGTQLVTAAAESSPTATLPACCAQPGRTKGAAAATARGLISLAEDITPFHERFNRVSDKPRFVAIVSSTCGPCVSGAVTTNEAIVKGFADAGIDVSIVWIDVLPSDGAESAARSSTIFDDPRVVQYHDANQLLGNAFAEGLLERRPAWDVYLFYPAGATWDDSPPKPIDWMHQLGGAGADRSRYKTEVLLAAAMHEAMTQHLGFEAKSAAPTKEQLASARSAATVRIGKAACSKPSAEEGQCSRCAASGTIGQCSVSGWRYIVASRIRDEAGGLTNRFEMSGDVNGPVTLGGIDASDTRHDYAIEGMACPDCTTQVAGKVLQVRGVTRVEVDYDQKRLIVFARDEHGLTLETLPMHLELAGFRVTPIAAPESN